MIQARQRGAALVPAPRRPFTTSLNRLKWRALHESWAHSTTTPRCYRRESPTAPRRVVDGAPSALFRPMVSRAGGEVGVLYPPDAARHQSSSGCRARQLPGPTSGCPRRVRSGTSRAAAVRSAGRNCLVEGGRHSPGARVRATMRAASAISASSTGASLADFVDSTASTIGVLRPVQATPTSLADA